MATKNQTHTPPARKTPPLAGPDAGEAVDSIHLHIAARHDGFRRCGRAWPAAGVTVPASDFSADQVAALKAEPELIVVDAVTA